MSDIGFVPWLIGAIVIGGAISAAFVGQEGAELGSKFAGLGNMTGKTRAEIVAVVGEPTAISHLGNGVTLLQWQATGYHIAINFHNDVFAGIAHEFSTKT